MFAMNLLAGRFTFTSNSLKGTHFFNNCLISVALCQIHVLSTVVKRWKNLTGLWFSHAKDFIEIVIRLRLQSIVSTHFTASAPVPGNHSESKSLGHVIYLWLPRSRALKICDILDFFNCLSEYRRLMGVQDLLLHSCLWHHNEWYFAPCKNNLKMNAFTE